MLGAIVLYGVVGYAVFSRPASRDFLPILEQLLVVLGGVSLVTGIVLPNVLLSSAKKALPAGERPDDRRVGQACFAPFIVRLALFESIALYGVVLAALLREPGRMLPFLGVAIVAFLAFAPSEQRLRDWYAAR